jgi:hypothetical protein
LLQKNSQGGRHPSVLQRYFSNHSGTVSPLIGYGLQGSLAFGSNELFKKLITLVDKRRNERETDIMPMSQVFLSGILTGVVSTAVLVSILLYRLPQIISEYFYKNKQ